MSAGAAGQRAGQNNSLGAHPFISFGAPPPCPSCIIRTQSDIYIPTLPYDVLPRHLESFPSLCLATPRPSIWFRRKNTAIDPLGSGSVPFLTCLLSFVFHFTSLGSRSVANMAFVLSNNHTSPATRDTEDDFLSAALHAALQPLTNHSNNSSGPSNQASQSNHTPNHSADLADRDMAREKHEKGHSSLDIVVNQDTLVLRGTGVDVNPALLSGNVALYLSEPTSIKEITLQFRGKARIPPSASES